MRIAYICTDPGIPVFGYKGCSIHVQEVIRSLMQQGHEVELFAVRWGGEAPTDLASVPQHKLPKAPKGDDLAWREQVLLAHNRDLLKTLEKAGKFDLVYERYALWSFAAMEYAQAQGIPGILEVNAPLIEEQATHRGLIDRHKAEVVTQLVFKKATVLIAVSQGVADYLLSYPQTQDKVHIVPNGVNPDRFPLHQPPTLPSEKFTVGFVGSMKPWHGLPILVDAFTQLHHGYPDSRLLIVGDGPVRSPLEAHFMDHAMEDVVKFTGKIPPSQIPGYLASMDVAVAPYPAEQNFYFSPLKVYEYMAAGLPVVASAIGQIESVIEDDFNGLLYEPGNGQQLTHCLDLLRQQPELRHQLGKNARATIVRSHTWEQAVHKIVSLATTYDHWEVIA
ncbi:glycosyltransferase family 4 protein [Cyanobacterium sp. IPPAS B-1200]|uniref:glycosyltransferase family 4 protein n=1 Tax=Cyanobacterium sp. IPPAS B-1200 TaxID=1562720 RepID=UPI00085279D4|nr:glycosyltransferase family 4 protein [Cyanobacterium sp. IPPAS B-1200]OEJ78299.1 glycosyl transferase family 1 [Cyanobacterium sp. IPPAS B-1200]